MTTVSSASSTAASTGYSSLQTTGSGTGIDYNALIEAKVQSRLTPADKLDTKVKTNETKVAALTDLQDLIQDVEDAVAGLRNRTASTGSSENLFDQREAYLSGGGTTGADNVMAVTVDDGTPTGTYSVIVEQIATKNKIGGSAVTDKTAAQGLSGSLTIGLAGGSTESIAIDSDDSLADIAAAINKKTSTSGVVASVLKVSDTEYELVLTANETGKAIQVANDSGGVAQSLGLIDSSGAIANQLVEAKPAILSIDGVEITRTSNTIDDAIDGVNIDLYTAAPGDTITLEVSSDLTGIKSAITDFVDAYNALRDFIDTQQAVNSDGTVSDTATLFGDTQLRAITQAMSNTIASEVINSDGDVLSLATLGITLNASNKLEIDEDALNDALLDNVDDVQTLLGLNCSSSSEGMLLLRYETVMPNLDVDLDVQMNDDGTIASVSVGGDDDLFEVSGNRIVGKEGTAYDGVVLVYTGASGTVSVNATQGLFDQMSIFADGYADTTTGSLQETIKDLQDNNDKMTERSDTIKDRAEGYRDRLTAYYAKLEAAAETANIMLKQLKASLGLSDDDDD
jgi:flagellar hook-associated protein 2